MACICDMSCIGDNIDICWIGCINWFGIDNCIGCGVCRGCEVWFSCKGRFGCEEFTDFGSCAAGKQDLLGIFTFFDLPEGFFIFLIGHKYPYIWKWRLHLPHKSGLSLILDIQYSLDWGQHFGVSTSLSSSEISDKSSIHSWNFDNWSKLSLRGRKGSKRDNFLSLNAFYFNFYNSPCSQNNCFFFITIGFSVFVIFINGIVSCLDFFVWSGK